MAPSQRGQAAPAAGGVSLDRCWYFCYRTLPPPLTRSPSLLEGGKRLPHQGKKQGDASHPLLFYFSAIRLASASVTAAQLAAAIRSKVG